MSPYFRFNTPETQQAFLDLDAKVQQHGVRTSPMTEDERASCVRAIAHIYKTLCLVMPQIHFANSPVEAALLLKGDIDDLHRRVHQYHTFNLDDMVTYELSCKLFKKKEQFEDNILWSLFNPSLVTPIRVPTHIDSAGYTNVKPTWVGSRFVGNRPFAIAQGFLRKFWLDSSYSHLYICPEVEQHKTIHDLKFMCHSFAMTYNTVCIVDFPKTITFDDQNRLHNDDSASIVYRDGVSYYYWHGQPVPVAMFKEPLTVEVIDKGRNAEIRRAMIEKYGLSKYLQECGVVIDNAVDEIGNPLRLYWRRQRGDEAIVMLEMTNSTKDPDGSVRTYMRRVPPNITSAIEARNWVCGLDEGSRIDVQS